MGVFSLSLITLVIISLIIASYEDLKKREVYNWISYGLLFIAFSLRFLSSLYNGWEILISGLVGFGIYLFIGMLFYYTNQWGGADTMLLIALGMVIGADFIYYPDSWDLILFIILLFLVGAIYGLLWSVGEAIFKRDLFIKSFSKKLKERKRERNISLMFALGFLIIGFFLPPLLILTLFPILVYYLFISISSVEESCFLKMRSATKLVPGDWLEKRIKVKGGYIKKKSLEPEDLRRIVSHYGNKKILIKEGLPFVPNFLICYLLLIFGQELLKSLMFIWF